MGPNNEGTRTRSARKRSAHSAVVTPDMAILQAQGDVDVEENNDDGEAGGSNEKDSEGDEEDRDNSTPAPATETSLDSSIEGAVRRASILSHHWAKKKSRHHRKVIQLVLDAFVEMYEKGKGVRANQGSGSVDDLCPSSW